MAWAGVCAAILQRHSSLGEKCMQVHVEGYMDETCSALNIDSLCHAQPGEYVRAYYGGVVGGQVHSHAHVFDFNKYRS